MSKVSISTGKGKWVIYKKKKIWKELLLAEFDNENLLLAMSELIGELERK